MRKIHIKALSVAFVFNTLLSLSVPLSTYASTESTSSDVFEVTENTSLDSDVNTAIPIEELNEQNKVEISSELEKTENEISEEANVEEETDINKNDIDSTQDNTETNLTESDSEVQMKDIEINESINVIEDEEVYLEPIEELHNEAGFEEEVKNTEVMNATSSIESDTEKRPVANEDVTVTTYIESKGWQTPVKQGELAGTINQGLKLESFKINSTHPELSVRYRAYSRNNDDWMAWTENNQESNLIDSSDQIEAIQVELDGNISDKYDVYYRVYSRSFGWLGWAENGEAAGTHGFDYRIEAIEVSVVSINDEGPIQTDSPYEMVNIPEVVYQTHVQSYGWQLAVKNGQPAGALEESKRLEAFRADLTDPELDVLYRGKIEDSEAWTEWSSQNDFIGTIGQGKQLEAIEMKLVGSKAKHYDIFYRVKTETLGWLGWAKRGETSGTDGFDYQLEAIEIQIVPLHTHTLEQKELSYLEKTEPTLTASAHVQSFGWLTTIDDAPVVGTIGQQKRIEALRFSIDTGKMQGGIEYRSLVQGSGWQSWKRDGQLSGTEGQQKRLEAIEIRLYGEVSEHFDLSYKTHVESFGWLETVITGMTSGTQNISKRMEALQLEIVEKGSVKVNPEDGVRRAPKVSTSAHVQSFGWQSAEFDGAVVGTIGQQKRIEALRLSLDTGKMQGGIEYRSLVQGNGWQGWKRDGQLSGTEGQQKRLEAIEIRLYGEVAKYFDLTYKTHVESFGWLETVITGMPSGTQNSSKRMEALQIDVVEKGSVKVDTLDGFKYAPNVSTLAHVQTFGWLDAKENGDIVGTVGQQKRIEALRLSIDAGKMQGGIEYRSHVQGYGWQGWKRDGQLSGTEGQQKRLEAIEIRLYGEIAKHYDLTYKTHVESYGWLGSVLTGMASGTQMLSKRMEALQVDIVEKGSVKVNPDDGFKRAPIVYIDSGHGGQDPGASYYGVDEAWLNLSTGNRVIKSLREKGFDVRASRETDIHLELHERSSLANEIQPDILFSIHYNAMGGNNSTARGIETFIHHRVASGFGQETNRNNFITDDPRIAESLKLADLIHNSVIKDTEFYDRGVKGNNFHMLREPTVPAALIELGFVDNRQDSNIIKNEAYHQLAADAIVKGIVGYFGNWK